ncbi:Hypothetical predicted protein [Octopus vulgaris]|uniref:Uncharacterized protein n=1 Tax=Octopus vulgaris TaxID=6645 RepID=A0AA36F967_OCTVU|nr:Hypothetical predicted protein [Octopus vulgaris]
MPKSLSSSSGDESSIEREVKKIESLIFDNVSDVSESEFPALPKVTNTKRNTEERTIENEERKSFASAAGSGMRQLSTDKKELLKYKDMITERDGVVKVEIPEELTEEKKKIIIFKTFCLKARKIDKIFGRHNVNPNLHGNENIKGENTKNSTRSKPYVLDGGSASKQGR